MPDEKREEKRKKRESVAGDHGGGGEMSKDWMNDQPTKILQTFSSFPLHPNN